MATRNITSNQATTLAPTAPAPTFTRIERDTNVVVPPNCDASVILKQVANDEGGRHYVFWLLVDRSGQNAMTASYTHTGGTAFQCDIPSGVQVSAEALQPHFTSFLLIAGTDQDKPPIIK